MTPKHSESRPQRIAIFGAGALGLYIGGRLAQAGQQVTLVVRPGSTLGLPLLIEEQGRIETCATLAVASSDRGEAQDLVVIAVKAHQLPAAWPEIRRWIGPETRLLFIQNGLPWWYFLGEGGPHDGRTLLASDPDGRLAAEVDLQRSIACIVHKSAERRDRQHVVAVNTPGDRFIIGQPQGAEDAAQANLAELMRGAGLPVEISPDLRASVWEKLYGNVALNPLSAITGCDLASMLARPETRRLIESSIEEAIAVARACGVQTATSAAERLRRADQVAARGSVRTSMLQDRLACRRLEVGPIIGAVVELARLQDVATPHLDTLYACASAISERIDDPTGAAIPITHEQSTRKTA